MVNPGLPELLSVDRFDINQVCVVFNDVLLPRAINALNLHFSPLRLSKRTREQEPLPTATRQLSSYRTRMGTILEYGLSTELQSVLNEAYGDQLLMTFAVAHEYPDFYLRDSTLAKRLRIEMKSVDADSDEQAARFDPPTSEIDPLTDLVLFIGWEWEPLKSPDGEYPHIFVHLVLPAAQIAQERDRRLQAIGGKIDGKQVLVPSTKNPGQMVADPGNYGKLWRIISRNRRGAADLTPDMQRFEAFLKAVDQHSVKRGARKRGRYSSELPNQGKELL